MIIHSDTSWPIFAQRARRRARCGPNFLGCRPESDVAEFMGS